ncbi:putative glycosyltransferase, type 2 [Natrialba magadii ATCC 43099]|uniref:Glycosyltransferase, type 2 n=1 Tax=Natrialba magadii (strain ATCC 43099 / DSM 3394 / CCM 3739 / CIP 104546 / IAM 13178 / JCM 8861 / NBRC 102185 / NCIMB 2190 / MS3) TaxID=547559 RepID=D3SYY7_NATMM|nr:hypothetical protein [Natrialba magadii]ADD06179.1 putative glycosyltransferase, type 2 [Natrialba magadii ATCC 43099]ELY30822.1 glycosyltransferase-like protein [Natrialba magadii ATCC 43099]
MEYVQERIATLHDFRALRGHHTETAREGGGDRDEDADTDTATTNGEDEHQRPVAAAPDTATPALNLDAYLRKTAVIVPMAGREHESPAAERVLTELESLSPAPAAVFVPVRTAPDRIDAFREWLSGFSLPIRLLWCNAPGVEARLADAGLPHGPETGKGRDVWLALGPAAEAADYVVVHDADARSYEADHVRRLLAPLSMADQKFEFVKGYYARIEDEQLYGRLFRLFYQPLLRALEAGPGGATGSDHETDPGGATGADHETGTAILSYLTAFRYALAGEFAMTAALARRIRAPQSWGLEVGVLGDAFEHAGFAGSAQVDLGHHIHDHRAVAGDTGLEGMSHEVGATLLTVLESGGVEPHYETLPERYLAAGDELIEQYRADAAFNGLEYERASERAQLERYAGALSPPDSDPRLPRWTAAPLSPAAVLEAARPWLVDGARPEPNSSD